MDLAFHSSDIGLPNAHKSLTGFDSTTIQWDKRVVVPARPFGCQMQKTNSIKVESSQHPVRNVRVRCSGSESTSRIIIKGDESDSVSKVDTRDGGDSDGNDGFPSGGGGGNEEDDYEEQEFGPLLKFEQVARETESRGASLPSEMLEAAKTVGIRRLILTRYLDLQGSAWPLGFLMRYCGMLRNRMLADPSFLFKVGTEV